MWCLTPEHSAHQSLGKIYRNCWRQPVLNGLHAVLAAGKEIYLNLSGGNCLVSRRRCGWISSNIQKGPLRCSEFGTAAECWKVGPFSGQEE